MKLWNNSLKEMSSRMPSTLPYSEICNQLSHIQRYRPSTLPHTDIGVLVVGGWVPVGKIWISRDNLEIPSNKIILEISQKILDKSEDTC
jgi:hypothetical protein